MRINNLSLHNIGPFDWTALDFCPDEIGESNPPVIIITGENGTGKSIILDAIRSLFMGVYDNVERDIVSSDDFHIIAEIELNGKQINFATANKKKPFATTNDGINQLFHSQFKPQFKKDFIFDFWTSKLSNDSFKIQNIAAIRPDEYLNDALTGIHMNGEVTQIVTFFDYLQGSENKFERDLGNYMYKLVRQIFGVSLGGGHLSHVSRITLDPIVNIGGLELSLDKLSSGSLYLIQRFISLLKQVYSLSIINGFDISSHREIKGILLIDEAENHLHPKLQKKFLVDILEIFPKLQIIVTTHSPFIVSSIANSRVLVCRRTKTGSTITEETDFYSNKPVEDILMSPLFNTSSFNEEISKLMDARKLAAEENNASEIRRIEAELLGINPNYFRYLDVEAALKSLKK